MSELVTTSPGSVLTTTIVSLQHSIRILSILSLPNPSKKLYRNWHPPTQSLSWPTQSSFPSSSAFQPSFWVPKMMLDGVLLSVRFSISSRTRGQSASVAMVSSLPVMAFPCCKPKDNCHGVINATTKTMLVKPQPQTHAHTPAYTHKDPRVSFGIFGTA